MAKNTSDDSEEHADAHHPAKSKSRPFFSRGFIPLLAFILFIILFALIFLMHEGAAKTQYDALNQKSLAIREFGMVSAPQVMGYFSSYGVFGGVLFGIFTLVISYIIYGVARIAKWDGAAGLGVAMAYGLFAFYGFEFAYLGPGTVTWANGITAYIGIPLLWSSVFLSIIGLLSIFLAWHSRAEVAK